MLSLARKSSISEVPIFKQCSPKFVEAIAEQARAQRGNIVFMNFMVIILTVISIVVVFAVIEFRDLLLRLLIVTVLIAMGICIVVFFHV